MIWILKDFILEEINLATKFKCHVSNINTDRIISDRGLAGAVIRRYNFKS
jgi:hypothetical protein